MPDHNSAKWLAVRWLPATARGCTPMRQAGWYVVRICKCHSGHPVTIALPSPERAKRARAQRLQGARNVMPRCDNCRHWDLDENSEQKLRGACRRKAPLPISQGDFQMAVITHLMILSWPVAVQHDREHEFERDLSPYNLLATWPDTLNDDWCGEHEPKEPR